MINLKVVGLYASDFSGGETRLGDAQIIYDGQNYDVIDGNCGKGATRLISALKSMGIKNPYLHISHPHWDHRDGIRKIIADSYFKPRALYCQNPDSITAHNSEIKSDINALRTVINEARAKDIPVIYLNNGQQIVHGEIKFTVYRDFPKYTGNSDAYLNDGSLSYWFPEIRYLTTGDAGMWCANRYNLHPVFVKCGHHGNDMSGDGLKPSQMCPWLKKHGCLYYWDNDFSTKLTGFLMTGREDAANAGMTILDIHGDIVATFGAGKATIYHGGKSYSFQVPYNGKGEKVTPTWEKGSKGWWYKYPDGTWATGWRQIEYKGEPKWFLFDKDGWMLTGWRYEGWSGGESWFFMDYQTGVMKTGWNMLPWGDGKMDTFLLDPKTGAMLTGWQYSTKDGKAGWYYLDPKSGAMHTGWIFENGYWYFLGADGCMVTGWVDWKGRKCYLEPVSGRNQGHCYVSCVDTIGGKTYSFDADGYATEISGSTAAEAPTIIKNSGFHADRNCGTRTEKVKYIVIHYTGSEGTAVNNVNYFNNGNRGASAHYFVDRSGEIREYCDPATYYAWHCGGSLESSHHPMHNICTNRNSIGIEICTHNNGGTWEFTAAAVNAAITLTKYLMARFGVPAGNVCRHYDVTGKSCPRVSDWGPVGGDAEWKKFLAAITTQARPLTDNEKFIEEIGAMARADMAKSGICAAVTVAQAILESGWGKSDLAVKAKNIFGMKCSLSGNTWPGSSWDGKSSYNKSTGEYYSGSYTTVKADFRVYKSWAESVADHSAYLAGAKNGSALRYAGLVGCTDYRKAAQIIKNGGYATSPDYVTKICNIVEQYNLVRFNTNYSAPANTKPATTVTPAPASKVPYLVRVGSGVQIYKAPAGAVAKACPYGVYTIVEEKNGYGKLKSGAGWLKLSAVTKV